MARIAGVDLPREKRVEIGLTYVYGIGRPSSNRILKETDKLREPVKEPVSGMFFPEAWTEFMIHEEEQCLYLDCFFGPRNAVGYCFDIEVKENTAGLRKEQVLWVS